MIYKLNGNKLLFPVDRAKIIDIAVNDTLEVDGIEGARHVWTEQDTDFMENNPDDLLFLQIERTEKGEMVSRIVLQPVEIADQSHNNSGA